MTKIINLEELIDVVKDAMIDGDPREVVFAVLGYLGIDIGGEK